MDAKNLAYVGALLIAIIGYFGSTTLGRMFGYIDDIHARLVAIEARQQGHQTDIDWLKGQVDNRQ